jgi:hypothetical protein
MSNKNCRRPRPRVVVSVRGQLTGALVYGGLANRSGLSSRSPRQVLHCSRRELTPPRVGLVILFVVGSLFATYLRALHPLSSAKK